MRHTNSELTNFQNKKETIIHCKLNNSLQNTRMSNYFI